MNRLMLIPLLLLAGFGCSTPVNSTERAHPNAKPTPVEDKRIITNSFISKSAQIVGVNETNVPGGLIKVQVKLYNSDMYSADLHYKWEWFDNQGMIVDTPLSVWTPLTIESNEEVAITAVSPNPSVKDFRLKLQSSKD
jgi:uncharacterized protein YcfL